MRQNLRDVRPLTGLLMGALFLLPGLMILFIALDWIEVDPATIHAPRWVLGVCGGMFVLTGLGILYYGVRNALGRDVSEVGDQADRGFPVVSWLVGLVITGGMTLVTSWIAFGPGERVFSGSVGVGDAEIGGSSSSEVLGRGIFGLVALLGGLITVWGLTYGLRRLANRPRRPEP